MDKKTILAMALCVAIWLVWDFFFPMTPPKQAPAPQATSTTQTTEAGKPQAGPNEVGGKNAKTADAITKSGSTTPATPAKPEQLVSLSTPDYEAVFTTHGGLLKKFLLKHYKRRDEASDRMVKEPENLVSVDKQTDLPFNLFFRKEKTDFQLALTGDWDIVEKSPQSVVFQLESKDDPRLPTLRKRYSVGANPHQIDLDIELVNRSETSLREQPLLILTGKMKAAPSTGCMGAPAIPRKPDCFVNNEIHSIEPVAGKSFAGEPDVRWAGLNDQYFLLAALPLAENQGFCQLTARQDGLLEAQLMTPEVTIPPGGSVHHRYRLFIGPKRLDYLEKIRFENPDKETHLTSSVDYGWFAFLGYPMLWLLKEFYRFVGNYGVAIIFLTIVVKLLLLPLTQKSMKSMRDMAKLKPLMDEIRKKVGDDKQKLNQEMLNLYKIHKINPMSGCLPMLLQMPIWIALYRMLSSSVELYQTPFIPGWIDDLSFRDPYFIMPLVLGAAMFLQQKMTPSSADEQQAKMMLYIMPVMFTFIMLYLPAGLVLYIFVNSVLSIGHQLLYNRWTSGAGVQSGKVDTIIARP